MIGWLVEGVVTVVLAAVVRVCGLVRSVIGGDGAPVGVSVPMPDSAAVPAKAEPVSAVAAILATPAREGAPARAEVALFTLDEAGQISLAGRQVRSFSREDGNRGLVAVDALEFVDSWSKENRAHVLLRARVSEISAWFVENEAAFAFLRSEDASVPMSVVRLVERIAQSRASRPVGAGLCPAERDLYGKQKSTTTNSAAVLRVASDASLRKGRRGAGLGVVAENGRWQTKYCPEVGNINVAELAAINLAVTTFRARPLEILTDSKTAIALATGAQSNSSPDVLRLVQSISRASQGRTITYTWVRGHSGIPLNETADRLAVARRRHQDAQVEREVSVRVYANIVEDYKTAVADAGVAAAEPARVRAA